MPNSNLFGQQMTMMLWYRPPTTQKPHTLSMPLSSTRAPSASRSAVSGAGNTDADCGRSNGGSLPYSSANQPIASAALVNVPRTWLRALSRP